MKNLIIKKNIKIGEALKKISDGGHRCLVVSNSSKILLGTLSDGDLRRAIIKGYNLNSNISKIYKKNPRFVVNDNLDKKKINDYFLKSKLDLIPVVDSKKRIVDILNWNDFFKNKEKVINQTNHVIIMSGGKGTRLEPFTKILPKPLIPIKEKPVISHIIERFEAQGFRNISMIVNYKADILKAYLSEIKTSKKLKIIQEKVPLGTAGGLSLLKKKLKDPLILANCDLIVNTNFIDLVKYHKKNKFDLTMVASTKNFSIPYGVCDLSISGNFKKILEKPSYNFLINIGLYVLNPSILKLVKKNSFLDMNILIDKAKKKN